MQVGDKTPGGRYTFLDRLGGGGMGEVWLARDEQFGRTVAVKFLLEEHQLTKSTSGGGWDYQNLEQRFLREAEVMASLDHPGVPMVLDWSMEPCGDFKRRYIVMQHVEGGTLEYIFDKFHSLVVEEVACLAAQVCSVLAVAHDKNLIHRDLKPSNLMVDRSGLVRVLDFGIAILTDPNITRLTRSSQASPGTTGYMAPEVRTLKTPGVEESDLYSLGCVMYEALGGPVFSGTSDEVTAAHLKETPEPIRVRNPTVPEKLGELIDQMLLKDPGERPSGAREVYGRLRSYLPRQDFRGRESFDLTRPFVDPWCPLPRSDGRSGGGRMPPQVIAKPQVTSSSVAAGLRAAQETWETGRTEDALMQAKQILQGAKDHLKIPSRVTRKAWLAYATMLRDSGSVPEAVAELRAMLEQSAPFVGEEDSHLGQAKKILRDIE
ncbi:serine/threonine-protein kinase [Nocardiopsis sp. NPDC006198]|uniref:serine/threonine-protein kinase n=1 Tax=Nocardiopsis sp. NPDC006198 TaxID=3154472 RepID=UPI0033AADA55